LPAIQRFLQAHAGQLVVLALAVLVTILILIIYVTVGVEPSWDMSSFSRRFA